MSVRILTGDCRVVLGGLPAGTVQCCVTSPPYYRQRDYGHPEQIGQEPTIEGYVAALVEVFRGVRRVLRDDGTLWLNLGDGHGPGKQLLGAPWRVALALQADGWVLRSEIVWAKARHMPEKAKDRPTSAHEKVFLLTKGPRYFYDGDAIAEPGSGTDERPQLRRAREIAATAGLTPAHLAAIRACGASDTGKARETQDGHGKNAPEQTRLAAEAKAALKGYYREFLLAPTRNARDVWTIDAATGAFDGAHFATMPTELAERCIKAGSRQGDAILDPFFGAGTTALVADRLGRDCIGVELNPSFSEMGRERVQRDAPLFVTLAAE